MPSLPTPCVIFNPHAGRGRALRLLRQIRRKLRPELRLLPTSAPGEAERLAREAADAGHEPIIAGGGDGTAHEVANGILTSTRPEVVFSTWPIGSTNDYAFTTGLERWWRRRWDGLPTIVHRADVGRIGTPSGRSRFYINCLGVGFNGEVVVEARKIPHLRGLPLFTLATVLALLRRFRHIPMRVETDGVAVEMPTLILSVNIAQREGGFPVTAHASIFDGDFDFIHVGTLSRFGLLTQFPNMMNGTIPTDHEKIRIGRGKHMHLRAAEGLRIHLDGEFFCTPEDGEREFTIDVLPRKLRIETFGLNLPIDPAS